MIDTCDFSVSPSPFGLDFGTLDFGLHLFFRGHFCHFSSFCKKIENA